MVRRQRSGCPINRSVEVFGDPWTLVVLRDVMFGNRRTFGALMSESEEGISSSVLASRLEKLLDEDLLTRSRGADHAQRVVYSLTESAIQLVPILVHLGLWCRNHHENLAPELTARLELLEEGGPQLWRGLMDDLRGLHLHGRGPEPGGTLARLRAAFEAAMPDDGPAGRA